MILKINNKTKIILIFSGILFSLIFCEIFLGVAGLAKRRLFLPNYDLANINKETLVIFCLGDSYTYGIGAGFEHSYPAQLQDILNNKERPVRVFNFGVPGYNSSQTLRKFKKEFAQLKPDIVVLMAGSNDNWNFSSLVFRLNMQSIKACLMKIKIYKLLCIFANSLHEKVLNSKTAINAKICDRILKKENSFLRLIKYGNVFRDFCYYDKAKLFYNKAMIQSKDQYMALIELGRCYKLNKEYRQAIYVFSKIIKNYPENKEVYLELQDTFVRFGIINDTILFYEKMLKEFPENESIKRSLVSAYIKAGGDCFLNNDILNAKALYGKAVNLDPANSISIVKSLKMIDEVSKDKKVYLSSNFKLNSGNFLELIKGYVFIKSPIIQQANEHILSDNLAEIIERCKNDNVKIIISEYPGLNNDTAICQIMRELALIYKVPIVTYKDVFLKALDSKAYEYYFVSKRDSHCTEKGYQIMAENIAIQILNLIKN